MQSVQHIVCEKSKNILIIEKQSSRLTKELNSPKHQYSLKQNCFDPSQSSPPNEFMITLHNRMTNYNLNKYKQ